MEVVFECLVFSLVTKLPPNGLFMSLSRAICDMRPFAENATAVKAVGLTDFGGVLLMLTPEISRSKIGRDPQCTTKTNPIYYYSAWHNGDGLLMEKDAG
jgi:hypothetical protein